MTLLAKALYDNLADAPDELSFRKGDIVTVIERDVDGLVGWWLCLLHGRQGIAPGNRLKVFEHPTAASGSQGSLDDFSDSFDTADGLGAHGCEYDVLPAPVKALHGELFESPSPKTLKDVWSPSNSRSPDHSHYAIPSKSPGNQGDYDILPSRGGSSKARSSTEMSPAELYDIPNSAIPTPSSELYDFVPRRKPTIQSASLLAPNTPPPKFQNALSAFTAVPDSHVETVELYDTPKLKTSDYNELYDVPPSLFARKSDAKTHNVKAGAADLYDTPSSVARDAPVNLSSSNEALYDAPPSSRTLNRNFNLSRFRQDSTLQEDQSANTKRPGNVIDNQVHTGAEIYDIPVPSNTEHSHVPAQHNASFQDIYDSPSQRPSHAMPGAANEIYDTPQNNNKIGDEIYDIPAARNKEIEGLADEIYDTPPNRNVASNGNDVNKGMVQTQDTYDTLPSHTSASRNLSLSKSSEIYDNPPSHDIYDTPTSDDIYDQPPNRGFRDGNQGNNSLYDVPTQHDVNKVMDDISRFKTSNKSLIKANSRHQQVSGNRQAMPERVIDFDDDDYVDYQDIYGKEPPREMVKEMEKEHEMTPRVQPPKPPRKKSSFDQINMSAVKELKLTQTQAYDRLNKLHLAVDTSVTTLASHTSGDWLEPKNLAFNIDAINDMANKVKLSLRLLTEFGLGALVNAKVMDRETDAKSVKRDIEPLLECYYKMKVCILHLDGCKWSVPTLRDSTSEKFFATVNAIMILAGRVPEACRKLTSTLHFNIKDLFVGSEIAVVPPPAASQDSVRDLTERISDLKVKTQVSMIPENSNAEKGKLKQLPGTVNDKKVREILELDTRPVSVWAGQETSSTDKANGADMSPMEMKQEFQSRRQKGYNSTLPRRPPVPPKPTLPTNRRSMAAFLPDDEVTAKQVLPKADTLVTDFVTEDGRKKYASDPSRSPVEPEPTRRPEWGGSCPQLDDHSTYATPQSMLRATSSGTAASTTSTTSLNNSVDDLDANANLSKMASDSNLLSQTMIQTRVTEPVALSHVRSASLPWDDNKIPFTSYGKEQSSTQFNQNVKRLSVLDHRDSEALSFFLQRVESQFLILRDAVRNLTESVTNSEAPQIFVSHSKFVILTAHKVVHAGEELCGKLLNNEVKFQIKRSTARLADSIRGVVAGTKQAALDYPDQNSLMEMVTTVLSVGESVREVHKEAKKALEL